MIQYYVMNHTSRDPSGVVDQLKSQGANPIVSTMGNDIKQDRLDGKRYLGLVTNMLRILKDETECKWKILCHDDIVLSPKAVNNIRHILQLNVFPGPVGFYVPQSKSFFEAKKYGFHVVRTGGGFWTQCYAFPVHISNVFVNWVDTIGLTNINTQVMSEDRLWIYWTSMRNIVSYVVLPSFIQHAGYDKSTFGNPSKIRYERNSFCFDPEFDAKSVDWRAEYMAPYYDKRPFSFDVENVFL